MVRAEQIRAEEHLADRTYRFKRWSGRITEVRVQRVEFTPGGGIAFYTGDRLELAVPRGDWNDLAEVAA